MTTKTSKPQNSTKNNTNSFVAQAGILAISGILARILGFLYRIPLTNLIGDVGNSFYGIAYNAYNFFLIMSSAGIPAAVSKLVSEKRALGLHHEAHRIFLVAFFGIGIIGAIFMVIIFTYAYQISSLFNRTEATLALQALAPTVFIVAMMATIRGYFQGSMSTAPTALSQFVEQLFNAIFSVVLAHFLWNHAIRMSFDAEIYGAAGGAAGTGVGALAGLMFIGGIYFLVRPQFIIEVRQSRRYYANIPKTSIFSVFKNVFKTCFAIILGTSIFSIANLIDARLVNSRLVVAGMYEEQINALFGQLSGKFHPITNIPAAISAALALALIPSLAASKKLKRKSEINTKINTAFKTAMILCVPIAFGLGTLGNQIVALLFPNHPDGGSLFAWGFASIIFLALTHISASTLQALGKPSIPILGAILGASIKVITGYILIAYPSINIYGAIIGTTLCYMITTVINCAALYKTMHEKLNYKAILLKPIIASFAMVLGVYTIYHIIYMLVTSNSIATIIAILCGVVIYAVFMLIIRGFTEEDITILPKGTAMVAALKKRGYL